MEMTEDNNEKKVLKNSVEPVIVVRNNINVLFCFERK